jgi:hypothetical protein
MAVQGMHEAEADWHFQRLVQAALPTLAAAWLRVASAGADGAQEPGFLAKDQNIFNMEELTPVISPYVITERVIEIEPLEDDTFLEVKDKETGEITKYPITVLTPSQILRENNLLPPVPETGKPLPYIPLEKLPPELQKVYQDIKNMIDEMNKDSLERRDLTTMFEQ